MIALAILAAAAPVPPPPSSASDDEILVIAKKVHMIGVNIRAPMRKGRLVMTRCAINHPSGYAQIDAIPCDVAQRCMADEPADRRALEACVEHGSQQGIDAAVAALRAGRK